MLKRITKFIVSFFLILGIVFVTLYFYVKGHKQEVVNFIVNTISEKHNGSINFDDVTLKVWGNFTNPAFYVKNIVLLDSSDSKSNRFEAEDVYLNLSIKQLLKKEIQVKSIRIENANFNSITYKEDLAALLAKKDSLPEKELISDVFKEYKMSLIIEDFSFDIQNIPRHKRFKFNIEEISSKILVGSDQISSTLNLNAHITQLGFNIEKGSFLKDSKIKGTLHPFIDLTNKKIHIPSFDLSINDQIFKLTTDFDISKQSSFLFHIENEKTAYAPTLKLISEHIQLKLNEYSVKQEFSTITTIQGRFKPFANPLIHIKFNTEGNSALINERFDLDSLSFNGSFTNRIYNDDRAKTEDKKDIKLIFNSMTGKYKETKFELSNGILLSTPEDKGQIKGYIKANGLPENLFSLKDDPIFTFKNGHFNLIGNFEGDATSFSDLLSLSTITLNFENTELNSTKDNISIPVSQLNFNINEDRAEFEVLKFPVNSSNDLNIQGEISHFSSLLTKDAEISAKTNLHIKSIKLIWEDFVNFFKVNHKKTKFQIKKPADVITDLAREVYLKFDPIITIDIKEFEYNSFQMTNFSSFIAFNDINDLNLNNTTFNIKNGAVKLNAALNIENTQRIIIDTDVEATGSPEILNNLFKSDTFFFKGGDFNLQGKAYGDILQMDDFLNALNGSLILTNSNVIYQPNNLSIPIDLLDVEIKNNLTTLNSLEIGLGEIDKLNFSGRLENFSAFLSETNKNQVNTYINLYSEKLQWDDFLDVFQKGVKKENINTEATFNEHIKKTLREIYSRFNPKISVNLDRFEYKDLIVAENFNTGIRLDEQNNLIFDESSFDYNKDSKVSFAAQVDISESTGTNIDVDFSAIGDPLNLNKILNYETFLLEGGKIEITAKIKADIEKMDELVRSTSAKFKIMNSALIHNPSKARIPFSLLEIDIEKDDAILKSLKIDLPSNEIIIFSGELKNITSIIPEISGNRENMSSKFNIYSNKLSYSEFIDLFKYIHTEKKTKNKNPSLALKYVAKDFYHKYQPELSINIDEFNFNKLIINKFKTGFYFENENQLYLENTQFDFYNGNVTLDAHLNISDPYKTDFSIGFKTDNIELEKLLSSFEYFNIPSIEKAKKIGGKVNMNTRIEGRFIDSTGIIPNTLRGTIGFNIQKMHLEGFEPIIKVGNIVFKKKRLEDIRFGSIENVLYIANNTVEFPLMEIHSTAFDFYVAGHLGYGEMPTNLWTAIPLSNFKSRDLNYIPDKKEYIEAGNKIYIEAKNGKENKIKYKLHLSNKKYFKERDLLSQYKKMVKENKLLLKNHKRDSRKNN